MFRWPPFMPCRCRCKFAVNCEGRISLHIIECTSEYLRHVRSWEFSLSENSAINHGSIRQSSANRDRRTFPTSHQSTTPPPYKADCRLTEPIARSPCPKVIWHHTCMPQCAAMAILLSATVHGSMTRCMLLPTLPSRSHAPTPEKHSRDHRSSCVK